MTQSMNIQIEIESNTHPNQEQVSSIDLNKHSNLIANSLDSQTVSIDDGNSSINESNSEIMYNSLLLIEIEFKIYFFIENFIELAYHPSKLLSQLLYL
jgi:hypothetical protein